jgi:hypothetical protein
MCILNIPSHLLFAPIISSLKYTIMSYKALANYVHGQRRGVLQIIDYAELCFVSIF